MQPLLRFSAATRQPLGEARGPTAAYADQYVGSRGAVMPETLARLNSEGIALTPQRRQNDTSTENVGIGVILGLNKHGEVVIEDLAVGWPAALSSMLARGDVLERGEALSYHFCRVLMRCSVTIDQRLMDKTFPLDFDFPN